MSAEATSFCKSLSDMIDKRMDIMFKDPQKMVSSLALGKIKAQPFSDQQLANLRKDWFNLLPDPNQAAVVPVHQPFLLQAMSQTLRCMEVPDWTVLSETVDSYASGVPVGMGMDMPGTPAVFARKTRWRKYDDTEQVFEMTNYKSAAEAGDSLQEQFEAEVRDGMMFPVSLAVAKQLYPGDRLRIAAQGALLKPDGSYRPLHDATHGVRVNNEARPKDLVSYPGPAEEAISEETSKRNLPGGRFSGKVVLVRRFEEGLGRLGFAARTLLWMKPFLAPLYSWAAAVPKGSALKPPLLVTLIIAFILNTLRCRQHRVSCSSPERQVGELCRTDSKGADDCVVLAGWETRQVIAKETARWFSLKLEKRTVPWLFKDGEGFFGRALRRSSWLRRWKCRCSRLLRTVRAGAMGKSC